MAVDVEFGDDKFAEVDSKVESDMGREFLEAFNQVFKPLADDVVR